MTSRVCSASMCATIIILSSQPHRNVAEHTGRHTPVDNFSKNVTRPDTVATTLERRSGEKPTSRCSGTWRRWRLTMAIAGAYSNDRTG
jgi:hypothetical protein